MTLMNGNLIVNETLIFLANETTFWVDSIIFFISIPPLKMHLFSFAFVPCGPWWSGESTRGEPFDSQVL